ncbi:hypothetical protein HHK36_011590 [Tetracentron sinense]|uniref:Uncharacterized protein n=1 Tax=Tetracentron sinense TaxID=13715 RepID=A0A835DHF4_TETSI|nr:hypothetical protein HHK36_011590 [Tetracentron sinense]
MVATHDRLQETTELYCCVVFQSYRYMFERLRDMNMPETLVYWRLLQVHRFPQTTPEFLMEKCQGYMF